MSNSTTLLDRTSSILIGQKKVNIQGTLFQNSGVFKILLWIYINYLFTKKVSFLKKQNFRKSILLPILRNLKTL